LFGGREGCRIGPGQLTKPVPGARGRFLFFWGGTRERAAVGSPNNRLKKKFLGKGYWP